MPEIKTPIRFCLLLPLLGLILLAPVVGADEPTAPNQAAPNQATPNQATPNQATPSETMPGKNMPGEKTQPDQPATPQETPVLDPTKQAPADPVDAADADATEPAGANPESPASNPETDPETGTQTAPESQPESQQTPDAESGPAAGDADQASDENQQSNPPQDLPLDDLRMFAEVFGRIKSDYVEPVDDHELLSSAIRGMLSGLDPHSTYLDPDEYRNLQVGTTGEFGGLGIEVGMEDGFVKVIAPIDDTPAQRAGMQAGDLIVRIDGKPVKGLGLSDAVKLMRGKPGTSIELTVVREGEGSPLTVTIERDIIKVVSVKSRLLEPGYGYLRISSFQARTTEDLLKAVAKMKAEAEEDLNGVVLDLRNNPGGVLNAAVGVSDAFLDEGLIVYTKGRIDNSKLEFKAGPDDILDGAPLVVLVNGGSASASEIVAGALQDQGRAIIMGGKTFGKGSVQTIVPVDESTALKLTTARYYTPLGRSIQAQGIEPDIELARGSVELAEKAAVEPLKEADLMRHLDDANDPKPTDDNTNPDDTSLVAEDYQLSEALNVLKGLSLYSKAAKAP